MHLSMYLLSIHSPVYREDLCLCPNVPQMPPQHGQLGVDQRPQGTHLHLTALKGLRVCLWVQDLLNQDYQQPEGAFLILRNNKVH